jgi:G3E family GTPase
LDSRYQGLLRLDSITCVVDAEGIFAHRENPELTMLKLRQIGFADLVVLNKVDLVGPENVEIIKGWIGYNLNRVRIVETNHCDVPLEILMAVGRFDSAQIDFEPESGGSSEPVTAATVFDRWSFETEAPLSLKALTKMVKKELPGNIYRCKGVVYADAHLDRRVILQAVGRRTDITVENEWGERTPRTQIVAIGAPDSIDGESLTILFQACVVKSGTVA